MKKNKTEKRTQILAISARPRSLDAMIGQKKVTAAIRKYGSKPKAWMFCGPTGVGKTTLARIIALSLQCTHSDFGKPCRECRQRRIEFDILEVNASQVRGVEDLGRIAEVSQYVPRPPSIHRVIILDEAQRMSTAAQNLLLKPFEDGPPATVWIICTTDPDRILKPLRSRCVTFQVPSLKTSGVRALVARVGKKIGRSESDLEDLVDALLEADVRSPRLVVQAVEQFDSHGDATAAARQSVVGGASAEALKVCRAVLRGEWNNLRLLLKGLTPEDVNAVLLAVMGYLRGVLLGDGSKGKSGQLAALGIRRLSQLLYMEDQAKSATLIAVLYELSERFKGVKWSVGGLDGED